jgi:TRAP-type C4-dicarboxylate transport system permease small subunit
MSDAGRSDEAPAQRIARWFAWLAGAAILFGCAMPIAAEVVLRKFFGLTVHSFEISAYAFAIAIAMGSAFTVTQKANIRVDILQGYLPRPLRLVCDVLAALALAVTAATLAWYAWGTFAQSVKVGARSESVLQVPVAIPQGIWWFGLTWFAVTAAIVLVQAVAALVRRRTEQADALIGSLRIHEEIGQSGVALDGRQP